MKRKNIIRFIVLPLLLITAASAFYIYKEYTRTHKNTAKLKPDYTMMAVELINEFTSNEQSSNKKYWDKVIQVEGMVKEISHDEKGIYTIALGDTTSISSVRCNIDSVHSGDVTGVIKGYQVTVKGICTGFNADELLGFDVILIRCVVDPKNIISNK